MKYFVRLNTALQTSKMEVNGDQELIAHAAELEKLQFTKREHEYLFTIEQVTK